MKWEYKLNPGTLNKILLQALKWMRLQEKSSTPCHAIYKGQWLTPDFECWTIKGLNTNFTCESYENGLKFYASWIIKKSNIKLMHS